MTPVITRFRAYQLGCAGSSFSYFAGGRFTFIDARLNDTNAASVRQEMVHCGVETAYCLHITSWDSDHCSFSELPVVLETLQPAKIECPGYDPSSDSGGKCLQLIRGYEAQKRPPACPWCIPLSISHTRRGVAGIARRQFRGIARRLCHRDAVQTAPSTYDSSRPITSRVYRASAAPKYYGSPRRPG